MVAIPRLFGIHRINVFDINIYDMVAEPTAQELHEGQFRLIDLFAWTAVAATMAGITRWLGLPRSFEWIGTIIASPVAGLFSLLAVWATLCRVGLAPTENQHLFTAH
ncbi:MAG: hypothetical protein IT427_18575 [Pirellulales bacterium]|nr:hypothetical protein [Pirellulales bacterium]